MHRPRFKSNIQSYSHINVQQRAPTVNEPTEADNNEEEDFVRKESLQIEIEEQLLYKNKLASHPEFPTRPLTFAEATMSTQPRGRGGRKDSIKNGDATLSGPMSLASLGPFKYTFKKKKKANKWSPFDPSAADTTSEVGSNSEVEVGSSRAVSPNPPTIFGSASFPSSPQRSNSTLVITTVSPAKDKGKGRSIEGEKDFNHVGESYQTPTQNSFEFTALVSAPVPSSVDTGSFLDHIEFNCSLDQVESDTSDTQSTKDRTEAAMASIAGAFGATKVSRTAGEDPFDSVEWDPDLPSASASDSPEPVIAAPQPLAYTTVGSLVNPNAVPQFTAPNRIQREIAGRRPLIPFIQSRSSMLNRHQDSSYFHPRDPPHLSMQSSMHYAQQLAQSPVHFYQPPQPTSSHSSRSTTSLQQVSLTDDEMKVLKRVGGPQMVSGNIACSPNNRNKSFTSTGLSENKRLAIETPSPKVFTNNIDVNFSTVPFSDLTEDGQRRCAALSGLEKMQTIQRLAKFENPMQELARSRLSALSVTNYLGRTVANPTGFSTASSPAPESMPCKVGGSKQGELDRSYQFPPPGFGGSSISQANPLFGEYNASPSQVPSAGRTLGVPQPLTAGPPGHRQYLEGMANKATSALNESTQPGGKVNSLNTTYTEYLRNATSDPRSQFYHSNLNQQSFINPLSQHLNMQTSQSQTPAQPPHLAAFEGEIIGSRLTDSLPISSVSKYYPNGLPSDMGGNYTPLSYKTMVKMGQIPGAHEPVMAEEKETARFKERDHQWYSGQRSWGKTTTDHINDMEQREINPRTSPYGAISPPCKKAAEMKPITEEEMKNMITAEAAKPVVDALFGTLLAYADRTETSESRRYLSGFEKSPEWLIDNSDKGNTSFFGEDWGAPPKRIGGGRRYQSAFHGPSTTHWE